MMINLGFIISKLLKRLNRPALRNCKLHKKASVGSGCNFINVVMDKYSYTGDNCVAVNATIGPYCSIASYCCIGGGAHPSNLISSSPVFYDGKNSFGKHFSKIKFEESKPVTFGADVWIGEKVFVKDGIEIGIGAIVGAHSVVTHDIPPYAIVGGVPARIIRYRFDEKTIEALLNLKWWEFSEEKLSRFAVYFQNKEVTKDNINAFKQIELCQK